MDKLEATAEVYEWSFPEVDLEIQAPVNQNQPVHEFDQPFAEDVEVESEPVEINVPEVINEHQEENIHLREELEKIKHESHAQISSMLQLFNKLKNPASIIDEELVELMQDIIKKISYKIIRKEIGAESGVLTQMINELKSIIDTKNGLIAIHLSQIDYQHLDAANNELFGLANIDNNLNEGDIIIKSNFAEVRAILSERIDQLIRIEHE